MGNVGSIFIKDDQLILLGRKSWKYVRSRSKLKWSLILVALMKKKFFFNVKEVALNMSAKTLVTLRALCPVGALPLWFVCQSLGSPWVSAISLLSLGEWHTITRCGICCWHQLGAHLMVKRAQWGWLGVVMVCGSPAESSGMSFLTALVLSYIASSTALKISWGGVWRSTPGRAGEKFIFIWRSRDNWWFFGA